MTAAHEGFTEQRRSEVGLAVGQSASIDLSLGVSGASEQVTVEGLGSLVNLSTQQTAGLVDERQIKDLPLNGRSYDQLITLNPATVNYTAQRSGSVGTSNSSVGNMFSISGRRPQDNLYLLNGIEYTGASLINVTPGGTSGQLLGVDAVREFQRGFGLLLGELRQTAGSAGLDRDGGWYECAPWVRLRISAELVLRRTEFLRPGTDSGVSAQ